MLKYTFVHNSEYGIGEVASLDCCLWLNRCKIGNADEIPGHLDIAALRGYFLGGSLIEWLKEHDGADYAEKLERLNPADPNLNQQISEIFGQGVDSAPQREIFCGNGSAVRSDTVGSFAAGSFNGSHKFGSAIYLLSSFGAYLSGSYQAGSYKYGSYFTSSFISRFRMWEWEWEWRFGGSFLGSFRGGSFSFGSYLFGSGSYLLGSFGGFGPGSFRGSSGFAGVRGWQGMTAEEYDRIMYECLRRCPLDCFGYGIHIV